MRIRGERNIVFSNFSLVFIFITSFYLWAKTTGYARYFVPGYILLTICSFVIGIELVGYLNAIGRKKLYFVRGYYLLD